MPTTKHWLDSIAASALLVLPLLLATGQVAAAPKARGSAVNECAALERELEDQMDASSSPCDDFYEHACGNWRAPYSLRALGAHDTRTVMRALNKQLLYQHLEEQQQASEAPLERSAEQSDASVVSFYQSCLSSRQVMRVYTDALRPLANWPLLNGSSSGSQDDFDATFDWVRVSAQLRRFGVQSFWRLLVQSNWQAADQRIFYLMPPNFELLRSVRSSAAGGAVTEESIFLYETYLKYLLLDLGMRVRRAKALAAELVSFERELLALTDGQSDQTLVLRAPQTLQQLAAQLPHLQLLGYFETLLKDLGLERQQLQRLLLVADTAYLERLEALLQRHSDKQLLAKWLLLQFLAHFEINLHEDKLYNAQREHCLQQLNEFMPRQLNNLYMKLRFEGTERGSLEALLATPLNKLQREFGALKLQFERLLNNTPVFENEAATHALALEKLQALRLLLPRSQQLASANQPEPQLSDNYDENLLNLARSLTLAQFTEVLQCLTPTASTCQLPESHTQGPLHVNAYYKLKQNAIELPLGLLRAPLWSECLSSARFYGGLGYILSHELLHAFDYDGMNYDHAGNMASGQWTPRAIIKFGVRAGCYLASRYSNATLTINENIADSEGLRLAYETFHEQQSQGTASSGSADAKTFFLAFAQTWCGHAATTSSMQHSSHRERVNNVLSNFPEFAATFQCKADSLMHPPDKCRIW